MQRIVEDISQVNADQLITFRQISEENVEEVFEPIFYSIQKEDTLWAISSEFYGNGSKYPLIVKVNLEVIKDTDKIYPAQAICIPELMV